ncbi:probable protein phosphatase 2C 14 isoform X2 [Salvia hispanica]|uniref:probable protein phosphatase 2C 14 isoform X2 n=1 Tax=Salvia hispanica TaxID=49212 RepID=UPI0020095EA7|nr:probable protein phosphatase 2C 14 isoform X2 [Salvia hispanica]
MANDTAVVVIDAAVSRSTFHHASLKRKRPPKIDIPIVLREIPADIFNAQAACAVNHGFSSSSVAVFAAKGKKKFMEDSHKIFHSSSATKDFFGVYDGHGGSKAAEFVAENLHLNIFEMLENNCGNEKEKAFREAYLRTDKDFLKQGLGSGVCCVTALIQGKEMAVSNLGDCRAVLCRDGVAEAITTDHKPEREDERRRIEDNGGFLEIHRGAWRVQGTLAVSRSIGDSHLKDWVMAEPDTQLIHLTPDMQYLVLASDGLWDEVSNQEAVDIVMQSCSSSKKLKGFSPAKNGCLYHCASVSPSSLSPRLPSHKSKRISHYRETQDEKCCERESPASSTPRMSSKTQFLNNENDVSGDKSSNPGLLGACKELVNLAVARGSLDDITVMIVDLSSYNG